MTDDNQTEASNIFHLACAAIQEKKPYRKLNNV